MTKEFESNYWIWWERRIQRLIETFASHFKMGTYRVDQKILRKFEQYSFRETFKGFYF